MNSVAADIKDKTKHKKATPYNNYLFLIFMPTVHNMALKPFLHMLIPEGNC